MSSEKIYGIHAVLAAVTKNSDKVDRIWLRQGKKNKKHSEIILQAETAKINTNWVTKSELEHLVGRDAVHQGVVASIESQNVGSDNDLAVLLDNLTTAPMLLLLDGLMDPHNLGACLRTADATGVHGVILPKNKGATVNATVCKVASGAAENIAIFEVSNLARTMQMLKQRGIWIIGTADQAKKNLFATDLNGPLAIVMGSEDKGLRRLTQTECDQLVSIPVSGSVGSLNVSAAAAVCLYEVVRQRGLSKSHNQQ